MSKRFLFAVMTVFKSKIHVIMYFEWLDLMACELYVSKAMTLTRSAAVVAKC